MEDCKIEFLIWTLPSRSPNIIGGHEGWSTENLSSQSEILMHGSAARTRTGTLFLSPCLEKYLSS